MMPDYLITIGFNIHNNLTVFAVCKSEQTSDPPKMNSMAGLRRGSKSTRSMALKTLSFPTRFWAV
jgi:hypothetical protein